MAKEDFEFFWNGIYSQWFYADMIVVGKKFLTAEQWMMYAKALLFNDAATASKIMKAKTPKEQKALGREVDNFDEAVWVRNRDRIVYEGNLAKFSQNPDLKKKLLAVPLTKRFVESSPVDTVWGIGRHEDDRLAWEEKTWNGLNLLGKALDKVRLELLK